MRLFDLHCDTVTACEKLHESLLSNTRHIDLTRGLSLYDSWAQVMAVFVPDNMEQSWNYTERVLSYLEKQQTVVPCMSIVKSHSDLELALSKHCCAVLPAVENGAAIEGDLSRLKTLSARGVVYMNITWNGSNQLGNGCFSSQTEGLTLFGENAVKEMYRVYIIPDVSHLNEAGFWDVARLADGRPFLAGHSNAKSVCDHPRNLTDAQFCAVKDSGGLVGLNLCEAHLGEHSFEQLERHLQHFLSLGGEHTVALGMDLDGTDIPDVWHGIAVGARLYEYFLRKQYKDALLDRIFFKNSYTFFAKTLTSKAECIRIGS